MRSYKALNKQVYSYKNFSIVPIRDEDRFLIMKWRNEQIYHLRQAQPLTEKSQNKYFSTVVADLFNKKEPDQILFSFLEGEQCVGYGGLVHINWVDKNAEISFVMNSKLESEFFNIYWSKYLEMLEELAFDDLNFHKLYVYAFDLRPKLYSILEENNYFHDATLKDHCFFNKKYIDVIIHSKLNSN